MIGSTLSRMAAAEKLSIPQLQQAIQDGTLPAYVGIPILQDKVKQEQQAKAAVAGAQQAPASTVADQVMQQAAQEQLGGIDQIPTQAPAMAGGGIVAFADGGDTDYAEYVQEIEDQDEDKRHNKTMQKIMALGEVPEGGMPAGGMSYADVSGGQLAAGKKSGAYKGITGDHKYADLIRSEANKVGLDPEYALKIAMIESGGLKNPETARSKAGAIGIMQLMPATAKGLGVDPTVPEENVRGGVSMLKRLVDKYNDYELAGAAYNAGEGRVDRALRSGKLSALPSETQGYMGKIRGMKDGGIAHFADPDGNQLVEDDERSRWDMIKDFFGKRDPNSTFAGTAERFQKSAESGGPLADGSAIHNYFMAKPNRGEGTLKGLTDTQLAQLEAEGRENATYNWPSRSIGSYQGYSTAKEAVAARDKNIPTAASNTNKGEPTPPVVDQTTPTRKPKEESYLDAYMKSMADRDVKRAEQADQDKWMSVLAAGLGMMGGTSPYAATNIGQGAMAGISNYANMRKQAAAQEAADVKNMLTAQRYKEEGELGQAQLEAQDRYRMAALGGKGTTQQESLITRLEGTYQTRAKQAADNEIDPRKKQAAYDAVYGQIYNDPLFQRASTALYGQPLTAPSATMPTKGTPGWKTV